MDPVSVEWSGCRSNCVIIDASGEELLTGIVTCRNAEDGITIHIDTHSRTLPTEEPQLNLIQSRRGTYDDRFILFPYKIRGVGVGGL